MREGTVDRIEAATEALAVPAFGMSAVYFATKKHRSAVETGLMTCSAVGAIVSLILSAYHTAKAISETEGTPEEEWAHFAARSMYVARSYDDSVLRSADDDSTLRSADDDSALRSADEGPVLYSPQSEDGAILTHHPEVQFDYAGRCREQQSARDQRWGSGTYYQYNGRRIPVYPRSLATRRYHEEDIPPE